MRATHITAVENIGQILDFFLRNLREVWAKCLGGFFVFNLWPNVWYTLGGGPLGGLGG